MEIHDETLLSERLWMELVQWRASYRCEHCGRNRDELRSDGFSGRLTGHHKDRDHSNSRLSNGLCLCPSCHRKEHVSDPRPFFVNDDVSEEIHRRRREVFDLLGVSWK